MSHSPTSRSASRIRTTSTGARPPRAASRTWSRFENLECTESPRPGAEATGLLCAYEWGGPIQDRFGVVLHGYVQMDIEDGQIIRMTTDSPDFAPMNGFPVRYLTEHHAADFNRLCGGGPGAFNGGEECALLYMDNLDAMGTAWDAENG